jgi:hypothetical protein
MYLCKNLERGSQNIFTRNSLGQIERETRKSLVKTDGDQTEVRTECFSKAGIRRRAARRVT